MTQQPANPQDARPPTFAHVDYPTWRSQVERALKGADFERRLVTRTLEGIDVQPLYTSDGALPTDVSVPGAAPYRRGALPEGRSGALWNTRTRHDHPDPQVVRRELSEDLARGARSVWLRFDRELRLGRVPVDAPRTAAERGVSCASAGQLAELLRDVPLDRVTVCLDAGGNALALAASFASVAQQRGLPLQQLGAWFHADPLGALARDGQLPGTLEAARAQLVELARFAYAQMPRARSVVVSTLPYHDAGAHAAQELGIALATGVLYLRWLTDAGLPLRAACSQIAFSVAVGTDFFMEIAKLRALRQCWAQVVAACGGDASDQRCELHASSSDRTKTARDPWVNLLRETTEAFAAAVGGADAITSAGFDRTIGPSDAFARRIAGNAQVILDEEAHVTQVADPAGGAYYVESLTDQLAKQAWTQLQSLEQSGGIDVVLRSGQLQREIAATADARDRLLNTRKQAITGVSEFADIHEERPLRGEPDWAAIGRARSTPSSHDATPALTALASASPSIERAIEAARSGATLEQLSRAVWGETQAERAEALPLRNHGRAYERLRDASDRAARARGRRPSVFLCNLGAIPQHKARAQFASGLFQAGGLAVLDNDGFTDIESAAAAFAASGAELCAICGSDDAYPSFVEALAPLLRARGAKSVVLAGRFGAAEASYRAAGVSESIYAGCDAVQTLTRLLASAGVES